MDFDEKYLFTQESKEIIGACFEVHNQLGPGFLEAVYQEALIYELGYRQIPFIKEKRLDVFYKGLKLEKFYIADFVCFDKIILEIKANDGLVDEHIAQVLNYLRATNYRLGLLINFGTPKVQIKRIIL
jgi:GxxExxY protein